VVALIDESYEITVGGHRSEKTLVAGRDLILRDPEKTPRSLEEGLAVIPGHFVLIKVPEDP
jgi:hypothetical protein